MGLEFAYIDGQTPIDEDEKEGLLIPQSRRYIAFNLNKY